MLSALLVAARPAAPLPAPLPPVLGPSRAPLPAAARALPGAARFPAAPFPVLVALLPPVFAG
ncbi:TetR family transcriptional regulator, partial [Mycobacterium tuberculosis]